MVKQKKTNAIIPATILFLIVLAVISIIGIILWRNKPVVMQGRVECNSITVAGKLPGRVEKLYVKEGDRVKIGDTLISIYSPEIRAQLMSANAMESVAVFQNKKVDAGAREEIVKSLKEAYLAAEANYELAEKSLKRSRNLYEEKIITPQKMDEIEALYKSAEAATKAAKYQYEMAKSGAQSEDIESARAMVEAAKGSVYGFESLLADSKLRALSKGEIGSVFVSEGELVLPGSALMNLIDTDSCYAVLNVREDYISQFYVGSEFIGKVPAFDYATLAFEVYYMNPLGSFANWNQTKGGKTYNLVTFQIKARPIKVIDTEKGNDLIKKLRPGMSILVELDEL